PVSASLGRSLGGVHHNVARASGRGASGDVYDELAQAASPPPSFLLPPPPSSSSPSSSPPPLLLPQGREAPRRPGPLGARPRWRTLRPRSGPRSTSPRGCSRTLEGWVAEHRDVAFYFKAPMAFLEAGDAEMAEMALDIAAGYVDSGGAGSKNEAYAGDLTTRITPGCGSAGQLCGWTARSLARNCWGRLYSFVHPVTCAGLVGVPYSAAPSAVALSLASRPLKGDLFATAEVAKAALLLGRRGVATQAGDAMVRALDANKEHMEAGEFFLRWSCHRAEDRDGPAHMAVELLVGEKDLDAFHCVQKGAPGQLYFLLAFPAMALLELHHTTGSEGYREAALRVLDFLRGCAGVFESPMAHKVARAAAMAGDAETARRIADFLVSQQRETGCYQEDPEAMDSIDQTAEIAVWLL
ncbi:unnamed protein product, partial [Prorocentrum cordatum]